MFTSKELKFVERREATINWDDAHVFCRDKSGKIYTINNSRSELNVSYKSHTISKNIGNGESICKKIENYQSNLINNSLFLFTIHIQPKQMVSTYHR